MNLLNAHSHPAFAVYALTCIILIANLLFLWGYSGAVRGKTKTAINHEDSDAFKAKLVDADPPEVARVLRAFLANRVDRNDTFVAFARRHETDAIRRLADAETLP